MITVDDLPTLVEIINTHPEWRNQLRWVLFPEIDIPKAFHELAEAQKEMVQAIQRLTERMDRSEARLEKVETRLENIEARLEKVEVKVDKLDKNQQTLIRDVGMLKGDSYERTLSDRATGIFGRFLRRGRDMMSDISELLHEAEEAGEISSQALTQVLATDLLWGGKLKETKAEAVLVVEASWFAEEHDLKRAMERAAILQAMGMTALPVVAGKEWAENLAQQAIAHGVVVVIDRQVELASWEAALSKV